MLINYSGDSNDPLIGVLAVSPYDRGCDDFMDVTMPLRTGVVMLDERLPEAMRRYMVVAFVACLHLALLGWGLLREPAARIDPVVMVAQMISESAQVRSVPEAEAASVAQPARPAASERMAKPAPSPVMKRAPSVSTQPADQPSDMPSKGPLMQRATDPMPPVLSDNNMAGENSPAAAASHVDSVQAQSHPVTEQPSSSASYLNNPKPAYPAISKRLGEEGRVMLRVLIDADGAPQQVQLQKSSGFERLDDTAMTVVKRWRFVPGKRGGVPEAMWFNVPIQFQLNG